MAEALPDDPSDSIKEEVTCPVCLELFDHPLLLPCSHTFCKACLETMVVESDLHPSPSLRCPQCQEKVSLPGGVGQLKKNNMAANIAANLRKSQTDLSSVSVEEKSDTEETRRGPDRNKQKSLQSQLRELLDVLERQQCATADQQERVQENLDNIASETAEKKRQVTDYFRKVTSQLQARERQLHQEVYDSKVTAISVLHGHMTSLESRMADLLVVMDKIFDLLKKNMSSTESSLQDEVLAISEETKRLSDSAADAAQEEMEGPAHLQISGPSTDSFCKGITLTSTRRQESENQAEEEEMSSLPDSAVMNEKGIKTILQPALEDEEAGLLVSPILAQDDEACSLDQRTSTYAEDAHIVMSDALDEEVEVRADSPFTWREKEMAED